MNSNERGGQAPMGVELTRSGFKGYYGNMADSSTAEFYNPDNSRAVNDNLRGKPELRVVEGGKEQSEIKDWLARSDTGKSLRMYEILKPKNLWRAEDYARARYILQEDPSREAEAYKNELLKEAKGIEKDVLSKESELEQRYGTSAQKTGGKPEAGGREMNLKSRQIQMVYELCDSLVKAGQLENILQRLNQEQLADFNTYWTRLASSEEGNSKLKESGFVAGILGKEFDRRIAMGGGSGGGQNSAELGNGSVYGGSAGGGGGRNGDGGAAGGASGGGGDYNSEMLKEQRNIARNTAETNRKLDEIKQKLDAINYSIRDVGKKMTEAMSNPDDNGNESNYNQLRDEMRKLTEEQMEWHKERRIAEENRQQQSFFGGEQERDVLEREGFNEDDRELYEGNIDEVLEARMDRIEYFIEKRKNPKYKHPKAGQDPNGPEFNFRAKDIPVDEVKRRLAARNKVIFWNKMEEYYQKSKDKGDIFVKEAKYLQELQRWAKVIIKNSQFGTENRLTISNEAYEKFSEIANLKKVHLYDYGKTNDDEAKKKYETELTRVVGVLREQKFTDYFKGNMGGGEQKATYVGNYFKAGRDLPNSIEETMQIIANTYSDAGGSYHTGGEYELVNAQGEFQLKNFWKWITRESWKWSDRRSQSGIDLDNMITIKTTWSQLPIIQLLETPQYLQHREFEISGNAEKIKDGEGDIRIGWGEAMPHPVLDENVKEQIKRFLWMTSYRQTDWAQYYDPLVSNSREKWMEAQYKEARDNNYVRNGYGIMKYQAPAHRGNEVIDFFKNKKQGSLGQAEQDAVMFTRYLSEFSEFYMERDEKGRAIQVKELEDNMAYCVLDYDASSSMLLHLSEKALEDSLDPAGIKQVYREYITSVMGRLEQKVLKENPGKLSSEQVTTLRLLVEKFKKDAEGLPDEKMRKKILLDRNQELTGLMSRIETEILGKAIVSEDEYKKWEGYEEAEKRGVTERVVAKKVRALMRENLYTEFFVPLMSRELPRSGKKIGEMEVLVDKNNRVVTQAEWDELKDKGKMKLREIMGEFKDFGKDTDELDYEKEIKALEERGASEGEIKKATKKYSEVFKRNERLAFGLLANLTARKRSDLNYFNREDSFHIYNNHTLDILTDGLGEVYGLDSNERDMVSIGAWYVAPQFRFDGINNTNGSVRIAQSTAFNNTVRAMNVQMGIEQKSTFFGEIKAVVAPSTLESWRVHVPGDDKPKTFLEVMQDGLHGRKDKERKVQHRWNRKLNGERRDFKTNTKEMRYDFINGIYDGGSNLLKILFEEKGIKFQDVISIDRFGNSRFDHERAKAVLKEYWEPIRLAYNKTHIDYDKKVHVDGREMTMREYMFGEKTQDTLKLLDTYYNSIGGKDSEAYKLLAKKVKEQPAVAVLVNMVGMEIANHSKIFGGTEEEWSLTTCNQIWEFLHEYLRDPAEIMWQGNKPEFKKKPPMLPYGLFNRVLGKHGGSMEKYAFQKVLVAFLTGLFIAAPAEIWREAQDEITQVDKTYTQRA